MGLLIWFVVVLIGAIVLAYLAMPGWAWAAALAVALLVGGAARLIPALLLLPLALLFVVIVPSLLIPQLRRWLFSAPVLSFYRKIMPPMSETERDALEAGTVGWDGQLFSGKPDWNQMLTTRAPQLTSEEQAFLDNETEQLCAMIDEWKIISELHDLPPDVWRFIKDRGFLGLIIPKEYGGKQFSAYAHSQIITKLSTRSCAGAVSVMVPNSLGPAELLIHYGTPEQKNHYLPRLARGEDIPCFALTSPHAGSDAASIPDTGIVCMGQHQGQETLGLRVTWDKRYITLGPVATVLGLAFRVHDPEHLLGTTEDLGITCALIPTDHPGVLIGRRHHPLVAEFQNGPNWGTDVFIPMDFVIGGQAMIGEGWKMLMNCLAAGRSISLPGNYVGMSKLAVRTVGGYARIRKQFKTPIGKFEGIEEALTRMGGNLYMMDAARMMTAGAIDLGEKPAVLSAIVKYHLTERGRQIVNDGMDIVGGKGICLGPNNFLAIAYMTLPIGITVEGANILTRSLIIFGQGAIRCHPFVLREMTAARNPDRERGVDEFDRALFGHLGFMISNAARSLWLGLTGATNVNVGTLIVNGSLANTTVNVAGGAFLGGTGSIGNALGGSVILASGTTAAGQGAISLTDGSIGAFTLTTSGTNPALTIGGAGPFQSILNFDIKQSSTDRIDIINGAKLQVNGGAGGGYIVNLTQLSGGPLAAGNYNLITYASANYTGHFAFGAVTNGASGATFAANNYSLIESSSSLILNVGGVPLNFFWKGDVAGGFWNANTAANTNWATDLGGLTDTAVPSPASVPPPPPTPAATSSSCRPTGARAAR